MRAVKTVSVEPRAQLGQAAAFLALGLALGGLLVVGREYLYGLQGSVSDLGGLLPFGYAFAAGMVAAVNPCGILLMPSLVAYYLGTDQVAQIPWWTRVGKAFLFGAMATVGFVALFTAVGLVFAASGRALGAYFPIGGLLVGVALAALGAWMAVTGRTFGVASASRVMGGVRLRGDMGSLFLFGVGYGVASLACTLPVFLVVVGTTLAVGGFVQASAQFVSFALGMGMMLTAVVVAASFFRSVLTRSIRGVIPYVHRAAASLLIGAGIFIIHYWATALM